MVNCLLRGMFLGVCFIVTLVLLLLTYGSDLVGYLIRCSGSWKLVVSNLWTFSSISSVLCVFILFMEYLMKFFYLVLKVYYLLSSHTPIVSNQQPTRIFSIASTLQHSGDTFATWSTCSLCCWSFGMRSLACLFLHSLVFLVGFTRVQDNELNWPSCG